MITNEQMRNNLRSWDKLDELEETKPEPHTLTIGEVKKMIRGLDDDTPMFAIAVSSKQPKAILALEHVITIKKVHPENVRLHVVYEDGK